MAHPDDTSGTGPMPGYGASTYGDAFADVYDDWYANVSDVDATVAVVASLAADVTAPAAPGRVLELAVGTGRLAIPLAATGLQVHGVDASPAMLARLAAKPGGDRVIAHLGDMASDLPDGPFAVAFVAYNSLFNLDAAGQATCVARVAERLLPGGAFLVEAFVPDPDRPAGSTVEVRSMSTRHVVLSIDVHRPEDQRAEGQFVEISESGGVRLRPWSIRYTSPAELDAMAAGAGLELADRWEDWHRRPFDHHSVRHVSLYRRR